jgi:hypothetical protein
MISEETLPTEQVRGPDERARGLEPQRIGSDRQHTLEHCDQFLGRPLTRALVEQTPQDHSEGGKDKQWGSRVEALRGQPGVEVQRSLGARVARSNARSLNSISIS